jgi:hypothetical protein
MLDRPNAVVPAFIRQHGLLDGVVEKLALARRCRRRDLQLEQSENFTLRRDHTLRSGHARTELA